MPFGADEAKIRAHFSSRQPVTDVKLMRNKDGKSRRFCFVGFKSDSDAADAVKYFNDSFMETFKISVEVAKTFSDDSLIPWKERKRRAQEAEAEREMKRKKAQEDRKAKKNKKGGFELEEEREDPKLKEFLAVYDNRQQNTQSWRNDDVMDDVNKVAQQNEEAEKERELVKDMERDSDDEYEDLNATKPETEKVEDEMMMSLDDWTQKKPEETAEENDEEISDMDWLRKHQTRIPEKNAEKEAAAKKEKEPKVPEKSPEEKVAEKIMQSKRLFLRNLLYTSTEEDFRNLFSKYGELEEVHLAVDTRTGKSKGFAYIQFVEGEDALKAYEELDKQIFQGRLLHILPAAPKKEQGLLTEQELKNLPLKKQNEIKRRLAASNQQFSWNTLYMNNDTVMATVAKKLGVRKADLLSPDSSDAAVTQALAEASVINSVRQYFTSKGVDLLAFNKKERSDTVILVKNIPFGAAAEEIAELFSEYGDLKKVLMPPDGGIAMVVFKNAVQARAAFSRLAYRRFKTSILYLEKGPKGLFEGDEGEDDGVVIEKGEEKPAKEAKISAGEILGMDQHKDEEDEEVMPSTSVFVKNLNFDTNTAKLTEAFKDLDGFVVAQVKTKLNPKKPGSYMSMGFGFVEFKTKEAAQVAVQAMDGHILDGHKLQLKISTRGQDETKKDSTTKKKKKSGMSTKIIIKNLPFEATKDGVYKIFSAPGGLRSVRVPRKFDKSLRGFAFAEYTTVRDAENALNTLQGTHYYGRHLVLEYAKVDAGSAEEEIAQMEAKVRKQVTNVELAGLQMGAGKRSIDLEENEDEDGM